MLDFGLLVSLAKGRENFFLEPNIFRDQNVDLSDLGYVEII